MMLNASFPVVDEEPDFVDWLTVLVDEIFETHTTNGDLLAIFGDVPLQL